MLEAALPVPHELVLMCIPILPQVRTKFTHHEEIDFYVGACRRAGRRGPSCWMHIVVGGIVVFEGAMVSEFWKTLERLYKIHHPHVEIRIE